MWTSLVANKDNEGIQSATKSNASCNHMNSRDKLDSCQLGRFGHYCVKTETTLPLFCTISVFTNQVLVLQRLALCPFIGFPHLQYLACFLCFVVVISIAVWVLDCETSCCSPERKQKQERKCEGCTIGNYYKLIQRILILEGLG